MSMMRRLQDGLANVLTGSGTTVDRKEHRTWQERAASAYTVETAFRSSWLMRKIVRVPAQDAVRNWIDWQAPKEDISKLEAEETRLRVKGAVKIGLILGRLGGGIVVMGVNDGLDPSEPVDPARLDTGSLRYLRPYSRHDVKLGPMVSDPLDDDFGEPSSFILKGKGGADEIEVHRSRVMVFKGEFAGHITSTVAAHTGADQFWGESVVHAVNDAVMNATEAQDEIAGLVSEAKIDIYGIPDLMNMMGDTEAEKRVLRRLEIAQQAKSIHRAVVRDAQETWEQKQVNWGGMPEVIGVFVSLCASASDIPATRLLGKSPDGMNSTGEHDMENYDQLVIDIQSDSIAPALERLHPILIPSALGRSAAAEGPDAPYYIFAPLHKPQPKDAAEVEAKEADSVSKLVNTALIPDSAMAQAVANRMIESGRWPGLEDALDELGEKWWEIDLSDPDGDAGDDDPNNPGGGGPGEGDNEPVRDPSETE